MNTESPMHPLSKVPAVTLGFWAIKILATTLGETAGDTLSMSFTDAIGLSHDLGYVMGTALFGLILVVLVWFQIKARSFHPFLYWATIIASTTAGTTLADFVTRSMGIGYTGGSAMLLALVLASLFAWYRAMGTISVDTVNSAKSELYYWITITFSQTLGTALGDWTADTNDFGYLGGATIFAILLLALVALYYLTKVSRVFLFWSAFILTRPLGATVGDFLDKPIADGGLNFSRPLASLVLAIAIGILIQLLPQRPASRRH